MKKSVVFPANLVYGLLQRQTVGYYDQPCLRGETDGCIIYTTEEKSYDKLYRVGFRRDKDGNAVSVTMENMMEHHGGEHKANFAVKPHEFVVVQDGTSDEISVFYYAGYVCDGMYYVGKFTEKQEQKLLAYVNGMRKFFRDYAEEHRKMAVNEYYEIEDAKKIVILKDKAEYSRLSKMAFHAYNRMHAALGFERRVNRTKAEWERDRYNQRQRGVYVRQCADGAWRSADGQVVLEDGYMEDNHF